MNDTHSACAQPSGAGPGRRLLALVYDAFLLAALWFVTTGIFVLIYPRIGLPMVEHNDVMVPAQAWLRGLLFPLLILETWFFYAWFWLHGGQTLGMRAWRLKTRACHGQPLSVVHTLQRFFAAVLSWLLAGTGWLLALIPPHQTLHDQLSGTETVVLPKPNKKG